MHGCARHERRDSPNCSKIGATGCFLLLVHWRFANKCIAYCHLLFWGVYYISKGAQKGITNVKADQQGRGEWGAIVLPVSPDYPGDTLAWIIYTFTVIFLVVDLVTKVAERIP